MEFNVDVTVEGDTICPECGKKIKVRLEDVPTTVNIESPEREDL